MANLNIKADDFRCGSSERWERFLDACSENSIQASVGVITGDVVRGLEIDKGLIAAVGEENFEIWNHGHEHSISNEGVTEFYGPSKEDQKDTLRTSQDICEEIFGSRPKVFGPPFNRFDVNTVRAIEEMREFDVSYDLGYSTKVQGIPKSYFVECEGPANGRRFGFDALLRKTESLILNRVPFVLQIHPGNHWENSCVDRFVEYVSYARACGYKTVLTRGFFSI